MFSYGKESISADCHVEVVVADLNSALAEFIVGGSDVSTGTD